MSSATKDIEAQVGARIAEGLNCAVPFTETDRVLLGHGSGGKLSAALVRDRFLPAFGNAALSQLGDAAVVQVASDAIAISTDTFVVSPLEFPGGNIGTLAVNGTLNDVAMMGARPMWLTAGFILEEGLPLEVLDRVTAAMAEAAREGLAFDADLASDTAALMPLVDALRESVGSEIRSLRDPTRGGVASTLN